MQGGPDGIRVVLGEPADQGVGVAGLNHHRAVDVALDHPLARLDGGNALALAQRVELAGVALEVR